MVVLDASLLDEDRYRGRRRRTAVLVNGDERCRSPKLVRRADVRACHDGAGSRTSRCSARSLRRSASPRSRCSQAAIVEVLGPKSPPAAFGPRLRRGSHARADALAGSPARRPRRRRQRTAAAAGRLAHAGKPVVDIALHQLPPLLDVLPGLGDRARRYDARQRRLDVLQGLRLCAEVCPAGAIPMVEEEAP